MKFDNGISISPTILGNKLAFEKGHRVFYNLPIILIDRMMSFMETQDWFIPEMKPYILSYKRTVCKS